MPAQAHNLNDVSASLTSATIFMKFEVGDIVTFKALEPGEINTRRDRIFQIVQCKEERCSIKQVHSGRVQPTSYLYRHLRHLTNAEKILYGEG